MSIKEKISGFMKRKSKQQAHVEQEKEMRENKSQKEIDKTLKDSFPASDPPSTY